MFVPLFMIPRLRSQALFMLALIGSAAQLAQAQTLPANFNDALVMGGWSSPVGATWDANDRMYVWEKRGRAWIVENGVRLATPLVNIEQEVGNWGDHGMLGFALDPNFLVNGYIYLMYAVDRHHLIYFGTGSYDPFVTEGNAAAIVRITRYTAIGPSFNTVDVNSRLILFGETKQTGAAITYNTHGAGTLVFGRDGTLLASIGEGASPVGADVGNSSDSYYVQALADGIIRPEENVGALRSQMVNSHSGKVLRLDPATGNGIPSNPWYDASAPRAPRSRVWALGLRNPYRMHLVPNTGSTDPALAQPGTLNIGDVGWSTWEELNVCDAPAMNFGWPIYEGMEASPYAVLTTENRDVPNPLYDGINCTLPYLRFHDLLVQDQPVLFNGHPNPCNAAVQIPNSIPKFFHARPAIDWNHANQSRTGAFNGNNAVTFDLDDPTSPVTGPRFGGYAAMAGPSSSELVLPPTFANSSFHGDYAGGWIRRFDFDELNEPDSVHDFASGLGAVNFIGADPDGCIVYIKYNSTEVRRICYTLAVNLPPVAVTTQSAFYGPGPLSVTFAGSGSSDPESGVLTYLWNFGDGSPTSNAADPPVHVFTAPVGVPAAYTITFTVTDDQGHSVEKTMLISVNNTRPTVAITSFANGAFYPVGMDTTFQLVASVTDLEHSAAQMTYNWVTTLHHNTHLHPGAPNGSVFSSTVINGEGCNEDTYYYDVTLTVTDAAGLSTTVTHTVLPRCHTIAPTAVINTNTNAGAGPLTVNFDGSNSYDPGSIVSYLWDFSDGTFSSSSAPTKIFSEPGDHQVTLTVTDDGGLTGTATKVISVITFDPPQCVGPAGSVLREYFLGVGGTTVLDLLNYPPYPNSPNGSSNLTQFQGPNNFANNFGARVRGYILAPQTGTYIFTLTSDDASVAYLSLNADPRYKQVICSVPGNTMATEYTKYTTQTSSNITLQAGLYYYVELIHKDGSGSDHCALRWQTPINNTIAVIPGSALVRWQNCAPSARLRANLEGPWNNSLNMMRDDLRSAGMIPTTEPFTAAGFTHVGGGGETVSAARLAVTGKNAIVDWVLVELRNASTPTTIVATRSALLERDGDIIGPDGYPRMLFNVAAGNYYVAVRHRNHLGAMTSSTVALSANEVGVDLTLSTMATYGSNAQYTLPNGRKALWSGNVWLDAVLRYVGANNDRDPILTAVGGSVPTATITGYRKEDVNMDGTVRYVGANNDRDPILFNIGGSIPTGTRIQQLP